MSDLVWLLFTGALFFVMIRWGCGAGHGHGGHGRRRNSTTDREGGDFSDRGKTSSGKH